MVNIFDYSGVRGLGSNGSKTRLSVFVVWVAYPHAESQMAGESKPDVQRPYGGKTGDRPEKRSILNIIGGG